MDWPLVLLFLFGALLILIAMGVPVAFAFLATNIVVGGTLIWGWDLGLNRVVFSAYNSVTLFSLVPLAMFILMGDVLFHSGIAPRMIRALDNWLGRLAGRLGLLAVGSGTLISTMSGASFASVAILGSTLVPDMRDRGYSKSMTLGPILGSGGLAIMIPPSGLAVLLAAVAELSIARVLLAIITPGILLAITYCVYIVARSILQPSVAPAYHVQSVSLLLKLTDTVRYVFPAGVIIFLVLGVIFFGLATPTEAAATGAIGTFLLAMVYRLLNRKVVNNIFRNSVEITVMIFMLLVGSQAFSQILVFGGVTRGLSTYLQELAFPPIVLLCFMLLVLLVMGTFLSIAPIIAIMAPLFFPIAIHLGYDPVWFAAVFLLTMEIATTSPPFGLNLFVMKGVTPEDITMGDIYWAAVPFIVCDLVVLAMIIAFPSLVLWLPQLAGY